MDEENADSAENKLRKKRKKFKNSDSGNKLILPTLILISILVLTYFLANYFTASNMLKNTKQFTKELNITSSFESWLYFVFNAQRQLYMDDSSITILSKPAYEIVTQNVGETYKLDSNLSDQHSSNLKIHVKKYKEIFNDILMYHPCVNFPKVQNDDPIETADSVLLTLTQAGCEAFMDHHLDNGLAIALGLHYNNIRYMISKYNTYKNSTATSATFNTNEAKS